MIKNIWQKIILLFSKKPDIYKVDIKLPTSVSEQITFDNTKIKP
jgi:hypothetical protein